MDVSDHLLLAEQELLQAYYVGNPYENPNCTTPWTIDELDRIKMALHRLGYEYAFQLGNY